MTRKEIKYRPPTDRWIELRDLATDLGIASVSAVVAHIIDQYLPAMQREAKRRKKQRSDAA